MHMADALLSPAVGATMWGVAAAAIVCCSRKVRTGMDDSRTPLMGVLGACIFAAQMINFTIPVTGSSGHLGGGLILSVLLGPYAAFLTISSVLVVQAFFFADGGLLALGCNMFNLGFFPAFIAYPLVYKKIVGISPSPARISVASMAAAIIGLQLGSFAVVLETVWSGITSLPFLPFMAFMQPIHLAIGVVEGVVTASVITFLYKAKPEIIQSAFESRPIGNYPLRNVIISFMAIAVLLGGGASWVASGQPDGLEWAITKVTGHRKLKKPEQNVHGLLADFQEKLSLLPDYSFRTQECITPLSVPAPQADNRTQKLKEHSREGGGGDACVSGIVGGVLALGLVFLIGTVLRQRRGGA